MSEYPIMEIYMALTKASGRKRNLSKETRDIYTLYMDRHRVPSGKGLLQGVNVITANMSIIKEPY